MFTSINFIPYFTKSFTVIKTLTTKKGLVLVPAVVTLPFILTNTQKAIGVLVMLMIFDFGTGIGASYFKKKKEEKTNPELKSKSLISSEKLKKSGVKFLLYSMTIFSSYFMGLIFQLKTFTILVSNLEMNLCIGVVGFWCLVECYSIFFENFKDMGVDIKLIVKKITSLISFLKEKSSEVCGTDKQE
jgi:hypothetical protein